MVAAISIGTMPTFGENRRQVEVHLLDFSGDLYGQTLDVDVVDWIREQRKFACVEMLKEQMGRDLAEIRRRAQCDAARPVVALR